MPSNDRAPASVQPMMLGDRGGVVIDVAALDVLYSFACHTLRTLAQGARLRGADTVVVGIQPDVALAMARLGTTLHTVLTALDLEEGLALLAVRQEPRRPVGVSFECHGGPLIR